MAYSFCRQCCCRDCEDQDNCAMNGCDGGGCEVDPEPRSDCDDFRPRWGS